MLAKTNSYGHKWHVEVRGEASAPELFGSFNNEDEAIHWISAKVAETRRRARVQAATVRLVEVPVLVVRVQAIATPDHERDFRLCPR